MIGRSQWIVAILLLGFAASGFAQILNPGFDAWSGGDPVSWHTNNVSPVVVTITQSTDAHSNSTAARGEAVTFSTFTIGPNLISGSGARGFAVNSRQPALHGWYKYLPAGADDFNVAVNMFAGGNLVGAGAYTSPDSQSVYAEFVIDITYFTADVPDTCIIKITITNFTGNVNAGSVYYVDDLSFGPLSAVEEGGGASPERFELSQNYPNPFNPVTVIRYSVPRVGQTLNPPISMAGMSVFPVSLRVYDLLGQLVATLVDGTQAPGSYSVRWDATNAPSGMYLYRLQAGSFSEVKKMILLR